MQLFKILASLFFFLYDDCKSTSSKIIDTYDCQKATKEWLLSIALMLGQFGLVKPVNALKGNRNEVLCSTPGNLVNRETLCVLDIWKEVQISI